MPRLDSATTVFLTAVGTLFSTLMLGLTFWLARGATVETDPGVAAGCAYLAVLALAVAGVAIWCTYRVIRLWLDKQPN